MGIELVCPKCGSDKVNCWQYSRLHSTTWRDEDGHLHCEAYGSIHDDVAVIEEDESGNARLDCDQCKHVWGEPFWIDPERQKFADFLHGLLNDGIAPVPLPDYY